MVNTCSEKRLLDGTKPVGREKAILAKVSVNFSPSLCSGSITRQCAIDFEIYILNCATVHRTAFDHLQKW